MQANEEKHKAKDQEDCKITSRASNEKHKRSNMEKGLMCFVKDLLRYQKKKPKGKLTLWFQSKQLETTNAHGPVVQNHNNW